MSIARGILKGFISQGIDTKVAEATAAKQQLDELISTIFRPFS